MVVRRILAIVTAALVGLLASGHALAKKGLDSEAGTASMTRSMMLAAGALIVTLVILVGAALVWYIRSQREVETR